MPGNGEDAAERLDDAVGIVPGLPMRQFGGFGLRRIPPVLERGREESKRAWTSRIAQQVDELAQQDADENRATALPSREGISIHSITLAEVYTPSTMRNLIDGYRMMEGERSWQGLPISRQLREDLQDFRAANLSGRSGGLPTLVAHGQDTLKYNERVTELPSSIAGITGSYSFLSASLMVVELTFDIKATKAAALVAPFSRDYSTFSARRGRLAVISQAFEQREAAVGTIRRQLRDECGEWLRAHLPGVFGTDPDVQSFPSCEYITTEIAAPYGSPPDWKMPPFLLPLSLDDGWRLDEAPGIVLSVPDDPQKYAIVLIGSRPSINAYLKSQPSYFDGPDDAWRFQHLPLYVGVPMRRWAVMCVLDYYRRSLLGTRDLADIMASSRRHAIANLQRAQQVSVRSMPDAKDVALAVQTDLGEELSMLKSYATWQPTAEDPVPLETSQLAELSTAAERIIELEENTRRTLLISGDLIGTVEDLRLQQVIKRLTWVLVAATMALLAVGLFQALK